MNYLILGMILLIVLLIIALAIAIKIAQGRKVQELEAELKTARQEAQKTAEYHGKKEEIQNHAEEQKDTLHTGDDNTDFNNSLKLLHHARKDP
jgi:predicted Holliday junction resolvase-like endonuclease